MPEIPLTDPPAGLNELDRTVVLAIMRRPFDADIARKVMTTVRAEALGRVCGHGAYVWLPVGDIALLARSESSAELLCTTGKKKGCFGGWSAGEILLLILNFAERAPQHASVNQAVHVLADDLCRRRLRNGKEAPCSKSVLLAEWSRFKPAVHLWAAFSIYALPHWASLNMNLIDLMPEKIIDLKMLAIAKELGCRAGGIKSRGKQEPVLDPGELWSVPCTLSLPRIDLHIPPVTDWTLEKLREEPAELRRTRRRD